MHTLHPMPAPAAHVSTPSRLGADKVAWRVPLLLLAVGGLAYLNSFPGAFVFDDRGSILNNPGILQLGSAWFPPANGSPAAGRPLVNFSLALNYAVGGFHVWSYHLFNLTVHLLAALTLFGLVRRTLASPLLPARYAARAQPLALAVAVLWMVHPLQTESVTFISQRAESLMGLFYLLTLYAFARSTTSKSAPFWLVCSGLSCLAGTFCKEVTVTAPLAVLLYDRTFASGTFAAAWRRHPKYYLALLATWLPLAALVWSAGDRGGSAGFGVGVKWLDYALAQFPAIAHYLALSAWPHPLLLDYRTTLPLPAHLVLPALLLIVALAAATVFLLWKRPTLGFLGAWFFVILAPSSSVIPIGTEITAEHRMYLPLAALCVLLVLALEACTRPRMFAFAVALLALAFGILTVQRNHDYRTELGNYHAEVAIDPGNERAHMNLGVLLAEQDRLPESVREYQIALALNPRAADTESNLGRALAKLGRNDEALAHYRQSLRLNPDYYPAHAALADALIAAGDAPSAITEYAEMIRLQPDSESTQLNLGKALMLAGQVPEATARFRTALQLAPDDPEAHYSLGVALTLARQLEDAILEYSAALRAKPSYVAARSNLAFCQMHLGHFAEAMQNYQEVLRLDPFNKEALEGVAQLRQLDTPAPKPPNASN